MAKARSKAEVLDQLKKDKAALAAMAKGAEAIKKLKVAVKTASVEVKKNSKPMSDAEE